MQNVTECVTDLHFKILSYRKKYLDNFVRTSALVSENRLTKELFENEEDCLRSLFLNN